MEFFRNNTDIQVYIDEAADRIEITAPRDFRVREKFLPREVIPEDHRYILSSNIETIKKEITYSRKDENTWPRVQYLWELHPIMEWIDDKVRSGFGRHEAPVIFLNSLDVEKTFFVISGLIPNRKGHPLIKEWVAVSFSNDSFDKIESFESFIKEYKLDETKIPNSGEEKDLDAVKRLLPEAISRVQAYMKEKRKEFESVINKKLDSELKQLEKLRGNQYTQLEFKFTTQTDKAKVKKEKEKRNIDQIFDDYLEWIEDTMTTEDKPFLQMVAVFKGEKN
jgi:hypothetical protein